MKNPFVAIFNGRNLKFDIVISTIVLIAEFQFVEEQISFKKLKYEAKS